MATKKVNIDILAKDKTRQALGTVQGGLSKVKNAVFSLQSAFVGLGAGLVIKNLVNTGRELENLQVRLKFLLKNTNEGAKAFDNMVKFASKVPFTLEEIQSGSGILATVTDNANDLQKMLEITGNVAAVTGLDFRTTAEQIQRSFSAGIGAADLFREKGVRNMLGFQAGAAVSIEETAKAFERVFGKGGRFGKATDDLANTFGGTLSMLGDKVLQFKFALLDAGFFQELKNQFGDLDEFLNENAEQLEMIAETIGKNLAQGTIKAAEGIKLLADNFRDLQSILGLVMIAFGGFFTKIAGGALIIDDINRRIKKLTGDTVVEFEKIRDFEHELSVPIKNLEEEVELVLVPIREFEHELSVRVPSAIEKAMNKLKDMNQSALEKAKSKFKNISDTVAEGINGGITKTSDALARSIILGENLAQTFKKMAQELAVRVLSAIIEIVARKSAELFIEKLITKEKEKQVSLSKKGSFSSFLPAPFNIIGSFLGFANGGRPPVGRPSIIGEKGPELFQPDQAGTIIPNHQLGQLGMSKPVTVNFNINTVDARGFNELLVNSRGVIVNMINSAVNEKGRAALI